MFLLFMRTVLAILRLMRTRASDIKRACAEEGASAEERCCVEERHIVEKKATTEEYMYASRWGCYLKQPPLLLSE